MSEKQPSNGGATALILATFIVVALMAWIVSVHIFITTPIQPGQFLSPGIVLSKCGILNFLTPSCQKAYLEIHPSGSLYYYQEQKLTWIIHGGTNENATTKTTTTGFEFKSDGTLWMGGEPMNYLEYSSNADMADSLLVPWPFTQEPKLLIQNKNTVKDEITMLPSSSSSSSNNNINNNKHQQRVHTLEAIHSKKEQISKWMKMTTHRIKSSFSIKKH